MGFSHVLEPIKIKGLEIKNRIFRSAHGTALGGGRLGDDLIAYHEARARGGVGLTVVEVMGIHPTSPTGVNSFDPALADNYPRFIERMKPYGMKVFQQVYHAGHNAFLMDGSLPWSASDVAGPTYGVAPIPMTKAMIDEIVGAFADAAAKCEAWGADGIEFHGAHGYLAQQFLSLNANRRQDEYGGSFENRARFSIEILEAIRAAVSPSFVVGLRVAPDLTVGGVGPDDNLRLAKLAEAQGLIDYVSVSAGNYHSFPKMIGGMHEPSGYELPTSTPITRHVNLPTMVIGRFRTLEEADAVIRAGDADMVGMTRATIADPDLVAKSMRGEAERVRPCIACNQGCVGQLLAGMPMGCAVNPAVGFEQVMGDDKLAPTADPKKVLVIGGGPAGMEAARVAALCGHRVTLIEAQPKLGGALRIAAMAPTRHGMGDILSWLEQEVYRLGVEVRLSTYATVDEIEAEAADAVILATGSTPRMDGVQLSNPGEPVQGMDQRHVMSSWDILLGRGDFARSAVVIDDVGHYEGVAAAELLATRGLAVTYVTRHAAFAPLIETALMTEPALQRLSRRDVKIMTRTRAVSVERGVVVVSPTYLPAGGNQATSVPADTVVFVSHNSPNRELAGPLEQTGACVRVIGDANSPRFLVAAMREGSHAGASIDKAVDERRARGAAKTYERPIPEHQNV